MFVICTKTRSHVQLRQRRLADVSENSHESSLDVMWASVSYDSTTEASCRNE